VAVFCLVLLLEACSGGQTRRESPAPAADQSAPAGVTSAQPPAQPRAPAVTAHRELLEQADTALARGDYETALALLDRAQRIDPDNGLIYLRLSRAYRASGDDRQARSTAERGMLYCDSPSQCDALREMAR
jgi:tetratricopeptide (TPR) repeat protein